MASAGDALAEIARRKGAVDDFTEYMRYVEEEHEDYGYNVPIDKALMDVERSVSGEIGPEHPDFCLRLIINMPPQHGKTLRVSENFPAWCMGRHPKWKFIWSAYNKDRANDYGSASKDRMESKEYGNLFEGVTLKEDSQAKDAWKTAQGGMYFAAGVGTATTGRGAHILGIDDPIKDEEEARSETRLNTIWNWLTKTVRTRMQPRGAIIIVETTWALKGLTHRLEAEQPGIYRWKRIKIACEAGETDILGRKQGEFLDVVGSRFPREEYEDMKAFYTKADPKGWQALYQQEPVLDDGDFFKEDMIRYYDKLPDRDTLKFYMATDYATGGGGDYTVFGIFAVDSDDNIYVVDWYRNNKVEPKVWRDKLLDYVEKYRPYTFFEKGTLAKAIGPDLLTEAKRRRIFFRYKGFASTKNKEMRAYPIQARMDMGTVFWPQKAWAREVIYTYLLKFPQAGVHDDDVDVLSLLGQALQDMKGGRRQPKEKQKEVYSIDYIQKLNDRGRGETFMSTPKFQLETAN